MNFSRNCSRARRLIRTASHDTLSKIDALPPGPSASECKRHPIPAYALKSAAEKSNVRFARARRRTVLFGPADSAAWLDRDRFRISLCCITGTIPCQQHTKGKSMSTTPKRPVARIKLFPTSAAIWRNEKDGRIFHSVTFERRYKDAAGAWQTSATFNARELLLLAKVADLAHTKICEFKRDVESPLD